MAIEFNCPYCTATIRVPDAYGGKQGRCPKCDTRLLVPAVPRPDGAVQGTTVAGTAASANPPSPHVVESMTDPFLIKPVAPVTKRRTMRRRTSRTLVVGIPVICFLVLLGLIFYSLTSNFPQIDGEVVAKKSVEKLLPTVTIPWADTGLTEEEQSTLREFLAKTPETLASQVMTCRLIGTSAGIEVSLTAGPESEWFAVEFGTNKPLALWLKNERSALNVRRTQLLRKALATYCKDKLVQISGEPIRINAMQVRDNVGIGACTGAFGSVLDASSGQLKVPCAFEDENGSVYFCLPAGTLAFQIDGRVDSDGKVLFPGSFTAVVTPEAAPAPTSDDGAEETKDAKDAESPDAETTDATMTNSADEKMDKPEEDSPSGMDNSKP